jgi:tetratricopeptide (TPR) repeat protein
MTSAAEAGIPYALRLAANSLKKAGRRDEAIDLYQRAAEAEDDNVLGLSAELLGRRAVLMRQLGSTGAPLRLGTMTLYP